MLAARPVRGGDTRSYDVVVVGAGIAGLVTALDLLDLRPELAVAVIDKGAVGSSGSTALAQGGLAAAVGADDSPDRHADDTLRAGDGLADPRAVAVLADEAPARVTDLVARGVVFDRDDAGGFDLAREGAQSVPRSVRAADATGAAIFTALRRRAAGRVERLQGTACGLVVAADRSVGGAWVLLDDLERNPIGPEQEGGLILVQGRATVLASGGCGGLYAATTNRSDATGDGVALAAAAGADLVDMEFVQFHPTGLRVAGGSADAQAPGEAALSRRLLLTEALRGAGAVLVDAAGRRFLDGVHPDAELAPRHVVTKAILDQPGGAWLDATGLSAETLVTKFPTVLAGGRQHGFDLAAEPVPVEPCQHYMMGGVATDLWGATSLAGLWAAGEVACTGVHGANRMAGNSLAQSCVFGHRAAVSIAASLDHTGPPSVPSSLGAPRAGGPDSGADLAVLREGVRLAMTAGAGPIRTADSLDAADKAVDGAEAMLGEGQGPLRREAVEIRHMVAVARLIVRSARLRRESRGAHVRDDAPGHHPDWAGVRLHLRHGCAHPG
ncbi:MAG TPA: FAD-dependent oxidoreductase [Egibacteraceae bacterium]|nr:FAD-dependent oxidoreductase [Egibacteraceae bacterium]